MKPYIITCVYYTEQIRTVSIYVVPPSIYWIGYNLTDISHRSRYKKTKNPDTMKVVVGNATTRNMTPSDIVANGAQATQ